MVMNYQSPIEVIHTQMQSQIEGEIYKAVMRVGVSVDKDELLKALAYDRNQYQKGYTDRDSEIIRCKDCKHVCLCDSTEMMPDMPVYAKCTLTDEVHDPEWFCADGERR
jgi:hypothetical protein